MKNKLINIIIVICSIFIFYLIIIKKFLVQSSIAYSLNIWLNNLFPTLFPFFIISDILINYNITTYIPKYFKKVCQFLFNITDNMLTILILSLISGFPSNARNTKLMYDNQEITIDEANHILIFSHFANPIFIFTTIAIYFLKSKTLGPILLISHYLSNFILGFLFRSSFHHPKNISNKSNNHQHKQFGTILVTAINKSVDTILSICGIVTVFLLLSSLLVDTLNLNHYNTSLLKGFFEITIGVESLSKIHIPTTYKAIITSAFLAFGGLSVHLQVKSQLTNTPINYHYFLIGRLYQTIISIIITYILCIIYHI